MSDVGTSTRQGWLDEPKCNACHQNGQRYATVRSTLTDTRFASNSLYRVSSAHGNIQCSACHGSTHAIYPSSHTEDNLQSIAVQGHSGTIAECGACHTTTPTTVTGGPHGMHTVGAAWITNHQDAAKNDKTQCKACHGDDYKGSFLSKTSMARDLVRHYDVKEIVGCYDCHNGPDGH